jgi:hypothetical protein
VEFRGYFRRRLVAGGVVLQVPRLRFAPVGMTKGGVAFQWTFASGVRGRRTLARGAETDSVICLLNCPDLSGLSAASSVPCSSDDGPGSIAHGRFPD